MPMRGKFPASGVLLRQVREHPGIKASTARIRLAHASGSCAYSGPLGAQGKTADHAAIRIAATRRQHKSCDDEHAIKALRKPINGRCRSRISNKISNSNGTPARQDVLSPEEPVAHQVGPGTPMGELLRRWMPIGSASELETNPIKPMRLMGGSRAVQGPRRPVRAARPPLPAPARGSHPRLRQETGIRCNYHGWLMNGPAPALSSPTTTPSTRARAPRNAAHQGLSGEGMCGAAVDLYGAAAGPELPVWEPLTWENGFPRSCFRTCPATGSSARRTPATPCTSSGCTTTGA